MTKTPSSLQELRRRIYRKAKSETTHRFWGLFVHVTKMETSGGTDFLRVQNGLEFRTIWSAEAWSAW
jgi:hypothetical protein